MAWYYTEPRPQRRPLDTPVRPAGGGGTGGPPTGPAGGDLTGTYPNPQVASGAVAWGEIAGAPTIPTTLPPSGPAGGDLSGSYPNPELRALAVGTPELVDGAVTDAKVTSVAYGKVTGAPTSLPPSGAASGDLSGSYPGPAVAKLNGAAVGTTTPLARGDVLVANATPVLSRLALGANGTVLQSNGSDAVWGTPLSGPPSGAASGDLTGTYPGPTVGALKITDAKINDVAATKLTGTIAQARFPTAPSGLLTTNINDTQITNVKIADVAWGKVTGAPTAFPPSGAAGGDLAGTYPNPTLRVGPLSMRAVVLANVAQSIPTATWTVLSFNVIAENVGGMFSAGAPDRYTIQQAGFYIWGGSYGFSDGAGAGTLRLLRLARNGFAGVSAESTNKPAPFMSITVTIGGLLNAGDFLQHFVYQDSGGALNTQTAPASTFWIARLA